MRKVIYSTMASLDGFTTDQDQGLEWVIIDEELHRFVNDRERQIGTYLFGRRMYDVMQYWDTADQDPSLSEYMREYAHIWKNIHKIVFSKTLERVHDNATLRRGNIVDEIARLKTEPGKALSVGGATIAATLMRRGLIDEYQLFVNPVVLGGGTPMFQASDHKINLRLVETHTFKSGVVFLHYQPAGQEQ